jgi:demethoxyubiquinone hydroxylase (CLK1/Coq7/Cat5 family)
MQVTQQEMALLNFYRASELHGGLLLGRVVGRARDPEIVLALTRHAAEEVRHAEYWTETMLDLGGRPRPVRATYQERYAAAVGPVTSLVDVLALTQVFERRVYRHFLDHLARDGTHERVRVTLRTMIDEEKDHLDWVKRWLDAEAERRPERVAAAMRDYAAVDERVYRALCAEYGWRRPSGVYARVRA